MERVYIYGLCRQVVLPRTLLGINRLPVAIVSGDKIGSIVSNWDSSSPAAVPENLVAHNDILEIIAGFTTVLPVRFGTLLSSEALDEFIKKNTDKILERLALVQGKVEMGLKVIKPGSPCRGTSIMTSESSPSGKAYMQKLFNRYQNEMLTAGEEEENLREVRRKILGVAVDFKKSKLREPFLLNESFLINKDQTEEFYRIVDSIKKKYPHLLLLASGPWPPYIFACWEDV